MRYFLNDAGGWMSVSGDADLFNVVPDGYREVTEAEFNEAAGVITLEPPQPKDPEPAE
ncbi:hypothetical protein [Streptomyces sp. CCM_MD2014]|uniref:hypothetical protein n=1 Tax=Streptomyces sp. CCM_MD2014 TaxID=1561022 RepID=UPI000A4F44E7|nr:hypothetical protein [Streptomyces sp. CCM_MD2014]